MELKEDQKIQFEMLRSFVEKISQGEPLEKISGKFTGETKKTADLINLSTENITGLLDEVMTVSKAGVEGHLDIRANDSKYPGGWGAILKEMNNTLDAVIGSLNVAAEYVERISRGDIPEMITDNYNGDFNEIKNNLNSLIDAENKVIEVAEALSIGNTSVIITPRSLTDRLMLSMAAVIDNNKHDAVNVMKMAEGNLDFEVKVMSEHDMMAKSCIKTRDTLRALVKDAGMLSQAAIEGRLDTRADVSKHRGEYSKIVQGVNETLDAVIGPLNVAAEYVERISRGDIPEMITDNYNGDFNEIKNNLNTCIVAVNNLVEDAVMLSEAGIEGRLDTRADASRHEGDFRKVVSGVNDTLDAVIGPLNVAAEYVERISRGDIPEPITDNYNGDFNEIKNNLNTCIIAINGLVADAGLLVDAAVEGKLDTRVDASVHQGDFRKIVDGVNTTLDTLVGYIDRMPLPVQAIDKSFNILYMNETGSKLLGSTKKELIGKKCFSEFNTGDCHTPNCPCARAMETISETTSQTLAKPLGKEVEISTASIPILNQMGEVTGAFEFVQDQTAIIRVTNYLNSEVKKLGNNLDKLSNGDTGLHIEVSKPDEYTIDAHKNFALINEKLVKVNFTIKNLVADAGMLSEAAVKGALDTRADASKHSGDFRKIVSGVNDTLDAVIGPLNVAAEYVERISRGDIPEMITDNYNGDFNEIKNNLNTCIVAVNNLVEDAVMLSEAGIEGRLDTRADASRHEGDFRKVVSGVNDTLDAVIGPLNVAAEYVERISRGDIPEMITDNYNGDFNEIKNNLNTCIVAVNNLVEDAVMLSEAGIEGRLDTRADASRHEGDFRKVVSGVNDTLDAVIGPLNVAAEYVERISRGDIPEMITDNYNGDFNEIKNNLNTCIVAVNNLVEDAVMLSNAGIEGRLDTRADASRHEGDFRKVVSGVNDTLDAVIGPLNVAAEYVERISRGDIPEMITDNYNGDFNEIKNNLNTCIVAVNNLVEDAVMLSEAGIEGRLDTRADASRHEGDFHKIVEGVNDTLDAVIGPLNVAAEYVERISRGDIPEMITDNYNGDFNEIKNNLNTCIVAVNNLVEDAVMLSEAGIEGRLDTRADASRHEGDFHKIVEGVNDTLDAVIGPLNVAAEYVERISRGDIPEMITDNYNGDFNEIKNNLNTCIVAVNNLVDDAVMLSEAGIEGRLDTRADASRHEGDFRKVVGGVNDTLDAVIGPLHEAIRVSSEFSSGNFRARVDEDLHVEGDFINFKDVLNDIGISVSEIINSAKSVTMQVVECSDEASRGADEVAKASGGVAMSSQKSSELTRELLYKIGGINREIIDLSASNEKIADTSKGVLSAANEVVRIGKDAQVLGKETNLKMASVEKIAKESVDGINNLTEQIKQIDNVVKLINDITSQINLLALNAAIEAARAGEHGRGFAVVAGEVKNLASKARNATDNIEIVVNSVQRDSKKTADAIKAANKEIIDGVDSVNKTLDALNIIIKNATQVTKDIGDIAGAIDSQVGISIKVVKASEEGNIMTREAQVESESLAAIAEETSASIQEIGAAIHEVTNLSNNLKSEMEKYRV